MTDNPNTPDKSKKRAKVTATAIQKDINSDDLPRIIAAGRGLWAEKIIQMAFDNGVKVREDPELAEMLAAVELDSEIPTEAIMAVAEILAYVYMAEGRTMPQNNDSTSIEDTE